MLEQTFNRINTIISKFNGNMCSEKEIDILTAELHNILISADIPLEYVKSLINDMKKKLQTIKDKKLNKSAVVGGLLQSYIDATFSNVKENGLAIKKTGITTIGIFGPNGVGKTSFAVKLANLLQKKYKKRAMCVSFDTTRFAAQEQLKILCENNDIEFIQIVENGIEYGLKKLCEIIDYEMVDILIIDNAGTSPDNHEGIMRWKKILETIKMDEKIIVLDGSFGQNALPLIKQYNKIVKSTGFAITKIDGDQKGGVFFSIATASEKPIYYITRGEKIDDICEFSKRMIGDALFSDDGLRQVIQSFRNSNQEHIRSIIEKNKTEGLNYNDLLLQLTQLVNFGKLDKVLSVLPHTKSFFNVKLSTDAYILIKKWISIIMSMTPFERANIKYLNIDRMNRIARGSGVSVGDVMTLQKKIEEINKGILQ